MGRNKGTNDYSNNFEPQVTGLLDARTRVDTKADLLLASTWTSTDGNVYLPKGIRVSVTDDTTADNNGVYMLMADDYTVASNWMKIGASGGSSVQNRVAVINTNSLLDPNRTEIIPLDVTDINTLKGLRADEILVYNGVSTLNKVEIIPVGFTFMGDDFVDLKLSYILDGISYYIDISVSGSGDMTADAPMPYSPDNIEEILLPISLTTDDSKEHTNLDFANKIREIASADNRNKVYYLYTSTQKFIINLLSQIGNYAGIYFNNVNVVYSITTTKSAGDSKITVYSHKRQEPLVSGTNIKTVNGQSLLGFGNLTIGGNDAIYLTTTGLLDNFEDTSLDSSDVEVLRDLYSDSITRIPNVIYTGLSINTNTRYYVPLNIAFDTSVPDGMIVAMFIHPEMGDTMVIVFDLQNSLASMPQSASVGGSGSSSNVKVLTTPDLVNPSRAANITLNAADVQTIKTFTDNDILVSASKFANSATNQTISIPLTMNKIATGTMGVIMFSWVYGGTIYNMILNISNGVITAQKPQAVTGSGGSADSKPDLTIDVKTGCKNGVSTIYYRIREVVPNGYIQFVRKKKTTYRTPTVDYKQSRYSVKDLSVHNISGVAASTLQPNVWYEFPISKDDLVSTYAKGSLSENGVARAYDMFKFNGNTHARPIEYSNMGTAPKATTVLHAGLQYNVLEDTFVNGTSASPIFKQRGEVIPIDVRLTVVDTSVFASGFKLIFAVQ